MKTIGFGSCNRQNLDQSFWADLHARHRPNMWLWTGDAYYTANNTLAGMHHAIRNLTDNEYYRNFVANVPITGVWDDHDYGINDAGRLVDQYPERRDAYREFLRFSSTSACSSSSASCPNLKSVPDSTSSIDNERGVYTSFDLRLLPKDVHVDESTSDHSDNDENDGVRVRFILLDTRSFRDSHWIRSVGEMHLPFAALFAAAIRSTCAVLGLGRFYDGDVLGEAQWKWLEAQLREDAAPFTVLVSSIQVLTSNPAVESWGHFPVAKRRLLTLLDLYRPSGLVILSGDVHYAESLAMTINLPGAMASNVDSQTASGNMENPASTSSSDSSSHRGNDDRRGDDSDGSIGGDGGSGRDDDMFQVREVTSSGLTHSCTSSLLTRAPCRVMTDLYSHFRYPSPAHVYTGRNYGTLQLVDGPNMNLPQERNPVESMLMKVTVYSMESHEPVLTQYISPASTTRVNLGVNSHAGDQQAIDYPETFFRLSEEMAVNVVIAVILQILFIVLLVYRSCKWLIRCGVTLDDNKNAKSK